MQELMAVSDIVINERVGVEVRTEGKANGHGESSIAERADFTLVEQRRTDLTVVGRMTGAEAGDAGDPVTDSDEADGDKADSDEVGPGEVGNGEADHTEDAVLVVDAALGDLCPAPIGALIEFGNPAVIGPDQLPPELAWQERALCAQTDPEAFFPEKGGSTREAKRVCMSCEVRAECLDYALAKDERFGIWGGLSERERRRVKKQAV